MYELIHTLVSRIARRDNRESQCTVYKSYFQKMYLDRRHFPAVPQQVHLVSEVQSECLAEDNSEQVTSSTGTSDRVTTLTDQTQQCRMDPRACHDWRMGCEWCGDLQVNNYKYLYYKINARALIGQSTMVYCASKLMKKITRLLNYYTKAIDHKFLWFTG